MFVAAGVSLLALSGCQAETDSASQPIAETPVNETAPATAQSALTVTVFDFIANAPGAYWADNGGGVTWGSAAFNRGTVTTATGYLNDSVSHFFLRTRPAPVVNGYAKGAYTVTIPAANLHPTVTATFGLEIGGNSIDGTTFSLVTQVNGNAVTLFSQNKTYMTGLTTLTADMSLYAGQTLPILVVADAGVQGNYNLDYAAWTDLRLIADSAPPPPSDGCTIGGVTYANGAVNPSVSCQVCDPTTNSAGWTIRADSCFIGSQCYAANTEDVLGCKVCDPLTSQASWINKAGCDNLVVAQNNDIPPLPYASGLWAGSGFAFWAGRNYPDDTCAAQGQGLGLPGTWRAMWSDPNVRDLKDTVPGVHKSKPVVNMQGQQLYASWDSIFTNQTWPAGLSMYKFNGQAATGKVWTGSNAAGVWDTTGMTAGNCATWTSAYNMSFPYGATYARAGDFSQRKILDAVSGGQLCNTPLNFVCVLVPPAPQVTVENYDGTAEGVLQGTYLGSAYAYMGVPYAAPPTGSLRLAPPAKVAAWSGVRNANTAPYACAHATLLPSVNAMTGTEDCLYLNIYAPKTATPTSNLPVLVFHHGGGLMFGSSTTVMEGLGQGLYDGDRFAVSQDAIIVTIQTRQGALGYLATPELSANATSRTSTTGGGTSGNYGLLDAVQSLKWIKRNIAKFGGDPNHVTFWGQSGGATLVGMLLSSPLAKDPADNKTYFSSAILESGFYEAPAPSFRHAQAAAQMSTLGCASASDKVACLRSVPSQNFVNAMGDFLGMFPALFSNAMSPDLMWGLAFGPNIDGYVLPVQPRQRIAAGLHNKMPVIVGSTKDEINTFLVLMMGGILSGQTFSLPTCAARDAQVGINLGTTLGNAATALYPCSSIDPGSPRDTYSTATTHVQFECPARRLARALDIGQTEPVRRYWFTHRADNPGVFQNIMGLAPWIGAAHALDLPYKFNTHSAMLAYWPSTRELNLTYAMQKYYRAFAATGIPSYTGGFAWTEYDRTVDNALNIKVVGETGASDPGFAIVSGIDTDKCDFWDNNYTLDGWH